MLVALGICGVWGVVGTTANVKNIKRKKHSQKKETTTKTTTHAHKTDPNDEEANQRGEPASHQVSEWAKEVGANQVGDGGRDEGDTQLPLRSIHRIHHPEWQGRLQHSNSHVGEGDGAYRDEDLSETR